MSGATDGILAIDQGTSATKAYVLTPDDEFVLVGVRRHQQFHPEPGWVEHDGAEILGNVRDLIGAAKGISAMGLANQGETVLAWDTQSKEPLGPAIVWQDERTAPDIARLKSAGLEALTLERAGLPLDPYFSASKLRWLLDHAPGAAERHRAGQLRLGTSDAFLLDALTGVFATDVSTASRTSLMDLDLLTWDDELCAAFGVPMECLPAIRPSVSDFGAVRRRGARDLPIVASIVDQQAALFGHRGQAAGDIKITFGTGAFALGLTGTASRRQPAGELIPTVAWRRRGMTDYALDGGIFTAGAAIEWLRGVGLLDDFAALERHHGASAAERGLFFVPALAGLAAPYWDRTARGAWFGLDLATTRDDLCRAVLEGIGFRAAELVRALSLAIGVEGRVSIDGGLSRSTAFARFLADALARPIAVAKTADMTAYGVALLCRDEAEIVREEYDTPAARWRLMLPREGIPEALHQQFAEHLAKTRGRKTPAHE